MTDTTQRKLYNGAYRSELEEEVPDNRQQEPTEGNTPEPDASVTPEEKTWKKRYSDLRSFNSNLTSRVKELELQLQAAQRKEIQLPSTPQEMDVFAKRYPDIVRAIRTLAMQEILQERENVNTELKAVRDNLEKTERELGYKKIMQAHPDFEDLNMSEEFHSWARTQPQQVQDWLFESTDPNLCIMALDLYKSKKPAAKPEPARRPNTNGADTMVRTRGNTEPPTDSTKRVWKASDIGKMHPKLYEKHEAEIEKAREEGRIDFNA